MTDKIYKYIKFKPNTGMFRSDFIEKLKNAGVCKMPKLFLYARTAHLSNVYGLVINDSADVEKIEGLVNENNIAEYIDDTIVKEYAEEYKLLNIEVE